MHIDTTIPLTSTEAIVLGVLARRPASGYDLRAWLDKHGVFLGYRASLSPIYRTLAKLQRQGCLQHHVEDRPAGPDAKVYRLTETGRQAVLAWARSPFTPSPRPMDPDFTIRFVLGGQFGKDIAIGVLRTELEYRLKQKTDPDMRPDPATDPIPELDPDWCADVQTLAHERGYASTAAYIAWLELALARLEK
ncbi:PadR family transcriptional regulator [Streptomyces blattellae]|uniref:PadR family transcriptional regulator n=1 Tax=Streptomyces blattellae TaxID=2569855 RepID=UPI0012B7F414|nr:PadR family transcriptional regulator [Streptomyces blattellae]